MVQISFKAEAPKQSQGFTYTPGRYETLVNDMTFVNKADKKPHFQLVLHGNFGEGNSKQYYHRMYDTGWGRQDLYKLAVACGLDPEKPFDTEDVIGKYIGVEIMERDEYNGKPQYGLKDIFALDESEEDGDEDWGDAE